MGKRRCFIKLIRSSGNFLAALLIMLAIPSFVYSQDKAAEGRKVYEKYCVSCHGDKGDGKGEAAGYLINKPRDFTTGMFKFKTTSRGSLPTDDDMMKVVTWGLPTSAMPDFRLVPDAEKEEVIAYLKSLSGAWKKGEPMKVFTTPGVPDFVGTAISIKKGKELFASRCKRCHGTKSVPDVTFFMKWGSKEGCNDRVRPANFNYGVIKRGPKVEDIYMSITAGIDWTPMLSFSSLLSDADRWHLTSYILKTMGKVRR